MMERIIYLFLVVAVGWAVTFGLRALPFLIFAGRGENLPVWVEHLGNIISPLIIAGLVVYSYSTLEWKTAWPYIAGVLTVGLQLLKRNALLSIVVGTVVYMCLLSCGCTTTSSELTFDARTPAISVDITGLYLGGEKVAPEDVPELLEERGIPHERTIHILVSDDVIRNLEPVRTFMAYLAIKGYRRSILVTKRHAEAMKKPTANP